jgi:hypothetical protein
MNKPIRMAQKSALKLYNRRYRHGPASTIYSPPPHTITVLGQQLLYENNIVSPVETTTTDSA